MSIQASYTIHSHQRRFGWDRSIPPVETVALGDIVECERWMAQEVRFPPTPPWLT